MAGSDVEDLEWELFSPILSAPPPDGPEWASAVGHGGRPLQHPAAEEEEESEEDCGSKEAARS